MSRAKFQQWWGATRLWALQLGSRERILLFVALVAGLLMVWDATWWQPLRQRARESQQALGSDVLVSELAGEEAGSGTDLQQLATLVAHRDLLQTRLIDTGQQIAGRAAGFVSPEQMQQVVSTLLQERGRLKLLRLANLDPEPIEGLVQEVAVAEVGVGSESEPAASSALPAIAYVHGLELQVQGSFQDLYDYLLALESRRGQWLWRNLQLDSSIPGKVQATLRLATLNVDAHWINL